MMFSYRLVRLIETHADTLAAGLEKKVFSSPDVNCFRTISHSRIAGTRVRDIPSSG